jgi:long-chain acyl-CoA synthetase
MGSPVSATTVSVLADGETESPFAIRRCPGYASQTLQLPPDLQTMQDVALTAFKKWGPKEYMGVRRPLPGGGWEPQFTFMTYSQCEEIARNLGSGLWAGLDIGPQQFLGIYSENRPEWTHTINATSLYGQTMVSLYDSFGENALGGLIEHSRMRAILVSQKNCGKLIQVLTKSGKHCLESVVMFGRRDDEVVRAFENFGLRAATFDEVCASGERDRRPLPTIGREWIHYVCYSSGTTGIPKGVIISHRSMANNTLDCDLAIQLIPGSERHLCYLPLAHVFERCASQLVMRCGGKIGFLTSSLANLMTDIQILKPTMFCAVPRVIGRIHDAVMDTVSTSSRLKRGIFWGMWYWKRFWVRRGWGSLLADAMVFNTLKQKVGGELRQFLIGGAAMDAWIHEFIQFATGIPVRVGYGLSELGSGNVINPFSCQWSKPGTVGGPMPNTEIRIEPISGYDDPLCGEILAGGQMLCSGYLHDEAQTRELFVNPERTWVRTGDIGKWDPDGYLMIVDRIRSVFKLSQGEFVAADLLTLTYELAPIVDQIFVYGDSSRDRLVAIVVPSRDKAAALFSKRTISNDEFKRICKEKRLIDEIQAQLNALADERKLPGYERIRGIACESEPWTCENDLLTPTFKLRRKKLADVYRRQIEELYGE